MASSTGSGVTAVTTSSMLASAGRWVASPEVGGRDGVGARGEPADVDVGDAVDDGGAAVAGRHTVDAEHDASRGSTDVGGQGGGDARRLGGGRLVRVGGEGDGGGGIADGDVDVAEVEREVGGIAARDLEVDHRGVGTGTGGPR